MTNSGGFEPPHAKEAAPSQHIYDMIIVGGGPGGYTAALYAARAGLDAVVLEQLAPGGQLALTERVDNYPGFDEGIDGCELGERMRRGARRFGVKTRMAQVRALALSGAVKRVDTGEGTLLGRTVVLATGAVPRELGITGERELTGRACTTAPPATGCSTGAKRRRWWGAATARRRTPCSCPEYAAG